LQNVHPCLSKGCRGILFISLSPSSYYVPHVCYTCMSHTHFTKWGGCNPSSLHSRSFGSGCIQLKRRVCSITRSIPALFSYSYFFQKCFCHLFTLYSAQCFFFFFFFYSSNTLSLHATHFLPSPAFQ